MVQKRCEKLCRAPPDKTACGFCGKRFMGSGGWEERMEHVGRHYENASTTVEDVGVSAWTMDMAVMEWALKEGVVVRDQAGGYSLVSMGKDAVVGGHGSR